MSNAFNTAKTERIEIADSIGLEDSCAMGSFLTSVTIKDAKGRILYYGHNGTVLGGRVAVLEDAFGIPKQRKQHLTLNEIMGIPNPKTELVFTERNSDDERYRYQRTCNYFMVGAGGRVVSGKPSLARNYETKLYEPIPFRCVPVSNDLSAEDRAQYRLRKVIQINGEDYVAYYAKKFEPSNVHIVANQTEYTPAESDTVAIGETGAGVSASVAGGAVSVYTQFTLDVAEGELQEYYKLKNGTLVGAKMNEIGLVTAYDFPASQDNLYAELGAAELFAKFISKDVPMEEEASRRVVTYKVYCR